MHLVPQTGWLAGQDSLLKDNNIGYYIEKPLFYPERFFYFFVIKIIEMRYLVPLVIAVCFLYACQSDKQTDDGNTGSDSLVVDLHPLPEIKKVDSIDMHFFPDINDQKVYTRFGVNDTAFIQTITFREMKNAFAVNPPCEYDTKFFCFADGQIVKTLYIAAQKDSCHYIGYIKSGGVAVKISMSDSTASLINTWRKISQ